MRSNRGTLLTALLTHCTSSVSHLHSTADERRTDSILEPAAAIPVSRRFENQVVDSAAGQYRASLDSYYRQLVSLLCPPSKHAIQQLFSTFITSRCPPCCKVHKCRVALKQIPALCYSSNKFKFTAPKPFTPQQRTAKHSSTVVLTHITKLSATCHHATYAECAQGAPHCTSCACKDLHVRAGFVQGCPLHSSVISHHRQTYLVECSQQRLCLQVHRWVAIIAKMDAARQPLRS